jgi:hypothetical protein
MPHRVTLWRRRTRLGPKRSRAGRAEQGGDLYYVTAFLGLWRLSNIFALWTKNEWRQQSATQHFEKEDVGFWLGCLRDLLSKIGDTGIEVVQVAFCDVAMRGKQSRSRQLPRDDDEIEVRKLKARCRKEGYSTNDTNNAVEKYREDPRNPAWAAFLSDSDSCTVTDPFGNRVNEGATIMRLKIGRCATQRIFPNIKPRMATYWRKHRGYQEARSYFQSIESHGLPKNIEKSRAEGKAFVASMLPELTRMLARLKAKSPKISPPRPASRARGN